jgi:hypothetical protein
MVAKPLARWLDRLMGRRPEYGDQRQNTMAVFEAYQSALGTPSGRLMLRDLAERFHLAKTTAVVGLDGMGAALESARCEGQRQVVLHILSRLNIQADDLTKTESTHNAE